MKRALMVSAFAMVLAAGLTACGNGGSDSESKDDGDKVTINKNPFPSTYTPYPSDTVLLKDATVLDGIGGIIESGDVLLVDGDVAEVAEEITAPDGATVVDASGKWVTPGIIDNHSHLGVYPSPSVSAHGDGNEISGAVTAEVWAEHGVWP
ncbi:MAG: amidohydrolase, partial [Pseudomonadota bacterium]